MRTWVLLLFCVVVIAAVANAQKQGNGAGKEDREKGKKVEGKEVKKDGKINRQKSNGNGNRERNKLEKANNRERNSKKNEGKDGKGPQKAKDRTIKTKSERDPKNKRPRNGGKVQNKPKKVGDRNKSLKKKEGKSSKQLKKTKPKQDCPGECVAEGDCQGRSKRGMMCDDDQVCCLPKRNRAVKKGTSVKRFCKPLSLCSDMEGECRKKKQGCNLDEKRYKNKKNKAYCDKKSCYCCVKQCKSRGKCLKQGGTCMLKKASKKLCAGDFVMGKNYCDGKKCGCCIPGGPSPSCKQKKTCTKEGGECVPLGSSCSGEIKTVNSNGKNYCKGSCGCCLEGKVTKPKTTPGKVTKPKTTPGKVTKPKTTPGKVTNATPPVKPSTPVTSTTVKQDVTPPVTSTTIKQDTTPPVTSTTVKQDATPPVTSTTVKQEATPPVTSTTIKQDTTPPVTPTTVKQDVTPPVTSTAIKQDTTPPLTSTTVKPETTSPVTTTTVKQHTTTTTTILVSSTKSPTSSTRNPMSINTTITSTTPNSANQTTTGTTSMGSSTSPCNVTRLYCSDCGIANISVTDSRIVNGSDASPNEYPYQVRLSLNFTNEFYTCGGSIIKRKWILTAAHCIINKGLSVDTIEVFYGSIDYFHGKSVMASRFFPHENYNETSLANDIALVELSENFDFSDPTIQSICIAEEIDIPFGGKAIATGWGDLITNGSSPFILQEVAVDIINNTLCKELFILPPEGEKAVCAFTPYKGICSGDSGGPLAAKLCNDRWVVFGISSYGSRSGCATATIPSVFTRVPPYRSWIDEKTGSASC